MRERVAILTTGRQDYGILRSTVHALVDDPGIDLRLWVGGMHLSERYGMTVRLVEEDGAPIHQRLPFLGADPASDAAGALMSTARALAEERPAALLLVGDRTETLAAGMAAVLAQVPIVHLHGGEETEGAVDNAFRHALTKLSALHLVSHADHAARVIQMGEDPARVVVVGAPGLDNVYRSDLPDRAALERSVGIALEAPVALVTVHPTTLADDPLAECRAVAGALDQVSCTVVITQPNADGGGDAIRDFWARWATRRPRTVVVDALGELRYWAMLRVVDVVVGNSSSGILEAPAAGVPSVNVGDRQAGRLRAPSTRDVPAVAGQVAIALRSALTAEARADAATMGGPYLPGPAAPRVVAALRAWLPSRSVRKPFRSVPT